MSSTHKAFESFFCLSRTLVLLKQHRPICQHSQPQYFQVSQTICFYQYPYLTSILGKAVTFLACTEYPLLKILQLTMFHQLYSQYQHMNVPGEKEQVENNFCHV